jgi:hypothetical protein
LTSCSASSSAALPPCLTAASCPADPIFDWITDTFFQAPDSGLALSSSGGDVR